MSAAPKLFEVQDLLKNVLMESAFFQAISNGKVKEPNPGTTDKSVVLADKGYQKDASEKHLRQIGTYCMVSPVLNIVRRDQSGSAWIAECELAVKIAVNPERNQEDGSAKIDIYKAISSIIDTLCRNPRHPGGEFIHLQKDAAVISKLDSGCWSYDIAFSKEVIL